MTEEPLTVHFKPPWRRRGSSISSDSAEDLEEERVCLAAIQGKSLPAPAQLEEYFPPRAAVHGICYHEDFAKSPAVQSACANQPMLARARNARLIMSNEIPDMQGQTEVVPYCIWHPQVAAEGTYRELALRYPGYALPGWLGLCCGGGTLSSTERWTCCPMSRLLRRLGTMVRQAQKFSKILLAGRQGLPL